MEIPRQRGAETGADPARVDMQDSTGIVDVVPPSVPLTDQGTLISPL